MIHFVYVMGSSESNSCKSNGRSNRFVHVFLFGVWVFVSFVFISLQIKYICRNKAGEVYCPQQ